MFASLSQEHYMFSSNKAGIGFRHQRERDKGKAVGFTSTWEISTCDNNFTLTESMTFSLKTKQQLSAWKVFTVENMLLFHFHLASVLVYFHWYGRKASDWSTLNVRNGRYSSHWVCGGAVPFPNAFVRSLPDGFWTKSNKCWRNCLWRCPAAIWVKIQTRQQTLFRQLQKANYVFNVQLGLINPSCLIANCLWMLSEFVLYIKKEEKTTLQWMLAYIYGV